MLEPTRRERFESRGLVVPRKLARLHLLQVDIGWESFEIVEAKSEGGCLDGWEGVTDIGTPFGDGAYSKDSVRLLLSRDPGASEAPSCPVYPRVVSFAGRCRVLRQSPRFWSSVVGFEPRRWHFNEHPKLGRDT